MRIKSYFSGTVEAAMALARRELGEDALLLNSRPAPPEARQLGAYEVVFGVETAAAVPDDRGGELFEFLVTRDIPPQLARRIETSIPTPEVSAEDAQAAIAARLKVAALSPETRALIFVGPAGTGKTTTLIKLAVQESLKRTRPVRVLSLDSRRIGAEHYLRALAAIAAIPFEAVESPEGAGARVEADGGRSLLLIDTPGFGPGAPEARLWASAIEKIPHREVHLVVTATTRTADLELTAERYRMFAPERLIFTRFDEASTAGGIVSLAASTGLPVSWLGTGQSIPEDLEAATAARIAARVLTAESGDRARAAVTGRAS